MVAAAGIAGPAAIVFRRVRLGVDDRALLTQLRDQRVVARRKIHVVMGVSAAGGAHVLGVVGILERERDAVHRHLCEIGTAAVPPVELVGALKRIGLAAELLAHLR